MKRGVAEHDRAGRRPSRRRPCRPASRNPRASPSAGPRSLAAATMACGQRMFAGPLQAGRQPQQLGSSKPAGRRRSPTTGGLALGERAGLVDHQGVDLLQPFQRLGVLDQHAGLRAAADADHDRHRRRQAQRAGAGDDQHRRPPRPGRRRTAAPAPTSPRPRRRPSPPAITAGTNQPDDLVGQALDRRAAALGLRPPSATMRASRCRAPTLSARMHEARRSG